MISREVALYILRHFAVLVIMHMVTASCIWVVIRATPRAKRLRFGLVCLLLLLLALAVYRWIPARAVVLMSVLFFFQHFGFVFRIFSSLYWFRQDVPPPSYPFYLAMATAGNSQHFGAGDWKGLDGERMSLRWWAEFSKHLGYTAVIFVIAWGLWWLQARLPEPWMTIVQRSVFFAIGLELLTHCGNLQTMVWSLFGKHRFFFGDFAWFTSKHIGQFWSKWNQPAICAFRELGRYFKLTRRPFRNTMTVFLTSGVLHQWMISYYTRKLTYGTLLSFVIHGLAVFAFGALYRKRRSMPRPLAVALFNPLTTAIVVLAASQPFVADLYGNHFVIWDPADG